MVITAAETRIDPDGWDAAVADVGGPQIVVGGPGTGKSEFLVRRVAHLVVDRGVPGHDILVVSFGRRGAADLGRRIQERLRPAPMTVNVATFHSVAAGIVEAHAAGRGWAAPPQILTGPEQAALVRDLLAGEDPADWPAMFRPLLRSSSFAAEVTDFLLRSAEQLLGPDAIVARRRDDWRGMPGLMRRYREALVERGRIDYGTLLAEAVGAVESGLGTDRYAHVLADEFQDITVAQARLLAALVAGHHHLTAAADPYQSIYSFRGAALENVPRFGETFGGTDAPARRLVLTTSFRTPAAVLASAERVTSRDIPGAAGPVTPAGDGGRVDVHVFGQRTEEAEWIAAEILRLHLTEGLPYGSVAVFVRSKRRFLAELSRALQRRGIPHDEPGSRQADQPAARLLGDLSTAAASPGPAEIDRAVRHILLGPCFALPLGTLRELERERHATGATWPEVIRSHLPEAKAVAELLDDAAWATDVPAVEALWHVWSGLPQLTAVATDPERAAERQSWASLSQVLGRWNDRNPGATIRDYHRLLTTEEFEAEPLLSHTPAGEDRVTVTTLHQAKGLEFDTVFVADAVEGTFPDLRVRDSLLGVRHLLPGVPEDSTAYRRFRLQEERRLAYTAMTRARRRVVWTATATGFEEGAGVPSRFLALVAGTSSVEDAATPPPGRTTPVTPLEAEAMLRRLAADPAAGGAHRVAALSLLAGGARWGLRSPWSFAGLRERGPDGGLVAEPLRLSPTHGEAYEECPRSYALTRRLDIAAHRSPHARLGTLVHAVFEVVERAAMERGEAHATLEEAEAELERRFDEGELDGEPHAQAWLERARESIRSLYGAGRWPGKGPAVALERRMSLTVEGTEWVGKADRIEDRGGKLAVVDHKTSGSPVAVAEGESSLQLGFYMLGAAEDPELAAVGRPAAAELWYPYAGRTARKVTLRPFDPARLDEVRDRLAGITRGIRAEDWTAVPSPGCERCPVRSLCPANPEGREGFVA